jgi:hypothetical protein
MRYAFSLCKRIVTNLHFLMFLNGFLLASMLYFLTQTTYEKGLFSSIKTYVETGIDADDTPDSVLVKSMNVCNNLLNNRASTFNNAMVNMGLRAGIFHSTAVDLMTTNGACGSYSAVLARVLSDFHYPVRIAQMEAGGSPAAHMIVEAYSNSRWVVLDPTFNVAFVTPDHRLATFDEISRNWNYYSKQTPANYNPIYRYENVRYANWTKVPVIMPAIRKLLSLAIGEQRTMHFCIRTHFLDIFAEYYYMLLILESVVFLITLRVYIKSSIFPSRDIPVTLKNLIRYLWPRLPGKAGAWVHRLG